MTTHNTVQDYGWRDSEKACSHSYLEPAILNICRKIGVKKLLDLGCGNGALSGALFKAGHEVVGCDADEIGLQLAKQAYPDVVFKTASVYDSPSSLDHDVFDAVVSAEVIEHLFSPRHLPRFARAVLKNDGYLIVTTPYHGYIKNLMLSLFNQWDRHIDPLWDGGHIKFWSRATMKKILEDEGFMVTDFYGVGRLPYIWKSMIMVARKC